MPSHRLLSALLLGGLLVLRAGPGHADTATLATVNLGMAGHTLLNNLPITLAVQRKAFDKVGLTVKIDDFEGGQKSIESLVGGSVDMSVGAYDNTPLLQAKGIDIVAFIAVNRSLGTVIGITKQRFATYKSPKDLKGYKFAVTSPGSNTARVLALFLAKGGLTLNDVSVIGVGGGMGAVPQIESGNFDGMSHGEPIVSRVIADGAMVPLVDTRVEAGNMALYGGYLAANTVMTRPDFIKSHPQEVQKFADAMVATLAWMHQAPIDQIMALVPTDVSGPDRKLYTESVTTQQPIFSADGRFPKDDVVRTNRLLAQQGLIPKNHPVKIEDTYTNRFVDQANK